MCYWLDTEFIEDGRTIDLLSIGIVAEDCREFYAELVGTMMDLPKGWPMYCRDIKQWCDDLGNPRLPEQGKGEHHALADARWNRQAWEFLRDWGRPGGNH